MQSLNGLIGQEFTIDQYLINTTLGGSYRKRRFVITKAYKHFIVAESKTDEGRTIRETFNRGSLVVMGLLNGGGPFAPHDPIKYGYHVD